jgi:hypothetical protein
MIDPKHIKMMSQDNLDGSLTITAGVLVRAQHDVSAKEMLACLTGKVGAADKTRFMVKQHERPLKAAVLNHIYGDLTNLVCQLKTLAKLSTDKKHQMEVYRLCTEIDKLLDMKI